MFKVKKTKRIRLKIKQEKIMPETLRKKNSIREASQN